MSAVFLYGRPSSRVCLAGISAPSIGRGTGGDSVALRRALRAAATVSLDEEEFVLRAQSSGAILEPAYDPAGSRVAGYTARWRGVGKIGPAVNDHQLSFDLRLNELRHAWSQDSHAQSTALAEWSRASSRLTVARDNVIATEPRLWMRALIDGFKFSQSLVEFAPADVQAWSWVGARVAGILSMWSQRSESYPGELAYAADELARLTFQPGARQRPTRPRPASELGAAAFVIGHLDAEDPMCERLLLGHLIAAVRAITGSYRERGETQAADTLEATVIRRLIRVRHCIHPEPPGAHGNSEARS
ncbi:MAG: hypothetical protein J2P17_00150 [Mycobacterium sp.]|nr:hypothetical protein [Mycobacterium sp.]